jgi:photosystem II stability/assembly factor-like uncharacterized protein
MKKLIFLLCVYFFVSGSSNAQWTVVNMGTSYNFTDVVLPSAQLFFATAYNSSTYAGVLYKSTNGGINWNQIALPSVISYPNVCDFSSDGVQGIIAGVGSIIYTSNSGVNWQAFWTPSDTVMIFGGSEAGDVVTTFWFVGDKINSVTHEIISPVVVRCANFNVPNPVFTRLSLPVSMSTYQLTSVSAVDSTTCYIGVNSNTFTGILKTTNSGVNWSQTSTPLEIWKVEMDRSSGNGFATAGGNSNCAIYNTTNYGVTWNEVFSYGSGALYGFDEGNTYFFAAGMQGKIFRSASGGNNWMLQNSGVSADLNAIKMCQDNNSIAIAVGDGGTLLMTTNGGVWIKNISSEIPDNYNLFQNYPNPFNPTTYIKYQITNNGFVNLKVFDIMGREISTLVNEKQNAGTYETQFDANNLASGIYFYRLKAGNFSDTKKLMVIK